ncbi:MAG: hypothetical protein ABIG28_00200 [archaeon]
MVEEGGYGERFFSDINTRIRDIEEKQSLLKDRMRLISESFVKERDKNFDEMQDMKKTVEKLKMDNDRMKEILTRIGELVNGTARKEELMILQRQFDLFRDR